MSGNGMDAVREGLARGLARFLAPARLPDGFAPAFASAPRGQVFDLAANAAAAEALAHPLLGGAEGATDLLLSFAMAGPAPRALGPARLVVADAAPRAFDIRTPHHRFTGNLQRGEIEQRLHGEDDAPPAMLHGGNLVEFTYRGRKHCLDVEDAIVECGILPDEAGVVLFHESLLRARGRFARGAGQEVARLRYAYALRAETPAVTLEVTLTVLPGVVLDHVRVTTACDGLSPQRFAELALGEGEGARRLEVPGGDNVTVQEGPVAAFGARQDRAGQALALTIRPAVGAPLLSVKASGPEPRRLHWLLARYAAPRLVAGERFAVREERMLLRGLEAPLKVARGADAASAAPSGAVALALAAQAPAAAPARRAALHMAAQRALAGLDAAASAPGELAQGLMAAQALERAGATPPPGRAAALETALLGAQRATGVFRGEGPASLGEHALALLALARRPEPPAEPLRRGLGALALATLPGPVDTLGLRGEGDPAALATEELAGLLRALRAVQAARAGGALALPEDEARRLAFLAATALTLLHGRIRPEGAVLVAAGGAPGSAATLPAQVATLAALAGGAA